MASTNKTTNYELSQFVETDRPAWLTDYNGDMRKLDTALKAVSDVASGASGSISELADRMSTAEGNITTNTNDITTLDARADALEAGAQSQAGTIANIQTEQTAQNMGIEAATELGYNLARPYDSASTYAVGAYVLFQNTLYKCTTAVTTGESFDPNKWLAIKATDEISSGGISTIHLSAPNLFTLNTSQVMIDGVADSHTYTLYNNNNDIFIIGNFFILKSQLSLYTPTSFSHTNAFIYTHLTANIDQTNIIAPYLLTSSDKKCVEAFSFDHSRIMASFSNNQLTSVVGNYDRSSPSTNQFTHYITVFGTFSNS